VEVNERIEYQLCILGKFRELSCILSKKDRFVTEFKGEVYATCVKNAMVYVNKFWTMNAEQIGRF